MIRTALFAALFATAGAAFAAPVSYNVDPTHTYASYEVNHLGLSTQTGTFTKVAGKLTVDEAAKSGSVDITIDKGVLPDPTVTVDVTNNYAAAYSVDLRAVLDAILGTESTVI